MKDAFGAKETYHILLRQLNLFWPTKTDAQLLVDVEYAINRTKEGWNESTRLYYLNNGFSVLNTAVYSVFLYYLGHEIGTRKEAGGDNIEFADKLYYLNKMMNSVEWYWNIKLPKHFIVEHPIGSVLGKGVYGDYFSIYQGVTVGERLSRDKVDWPRIGHHVTMFANSSVIGNCNIGNWVIVSANTYILNQNVPDCSIVFGSSPNLIVKTYDEDRIKEYFVKSWKL